MNVDKAPAEVAKEPIVNSISLKKSGIQHNQH